MKNSKFEIRNYLLSVLCALCSVFFSPEVKANPSIPEKLIYSIYWSGLKAGNASLEISNNPEGVTITSRAASADFISLFYKVDDMAQSILYQNGYPKNYKIKLKEGRHRRDKEVWFEKKQENKIQKVMFQNRLDGETVTSNLEQQAFDPLSGLYEIRKRQLQVGRTEYLDIFDNKKVWGTEIQVLRKERITTPAGEFNTIVIKPIMQSEGIFMKKGEIYIWLTDDEKKVPVMMRSKVKIGSITAELVEGRY